MPHVVSIFTAVSDAIIAIPSPDSPPRYSPMIAPRIAAGAAMRSAANKLGKAARKRTLVSMLQEPPAYAYTRSSAVRSALRRPSSLRESVGQKTATASRIDGDVQQPPSQTSVLCVLALPEQDLAEPVAQLVKVRVPQHLRRPRPRKVDLDPGDDPAGPWTHHGDRVGEEHGLGDRVGDEQRRARPLGPDALELEIESLT